MRTYCLYILLRPRVETGRHRWMVRSAVTEFLQADKGPARRGSSRDPGNEDGPAVAVLRVVAAGEMPCAVAFSISSASLSEPSCLALSG